MTLVHAASAIISNDKNIIGNINYAPIPPLLHFCPNLSLLLDNNDNDYDDNDDADHITLSFYCDFVTLVHCSWDAAV